MGKPPFLSLLRRRLLGSLAALAGLGLAAPAGAATIFDPAEPWITFETPHFRVNATRANLEAARVVAGYAEDAHARLAADFAEVPERKTELTCLDEEDTTNGFGFPLPNNQIFIYLTSPHEDMLDSRYDAWLRELVIHEYTHVLHLEKTRGLAALVKQAFGRSYFPNMFLPVFLIEGLAVEAETRHSTGGRGRSAYYEAITRLAALEGATPDIDQVSGYYVTDHPGGELPYVYGTAFYRYLSEAHGAKAAAELAERTAASPFFGLHGLDDAFVAVTGEDLASLWRGLAADLKARAEAERARILARGPLTPLTPVTRLGQYQRHPMYAPDGRLAWSSYTGHGFPYLVFAPKAPGGAPERLVSKSPFGQAAFAGPGGAVILARDPGDDRFSSMTDLFRFDPAKRRLQRLTKRGRLSDPAVSPDGRHVLAVRNGASQSNLVALKPDGSGLRPLTALTERAQVGAPAWHPAGDLAAASIWKDGARDPYLVDPETGALTPLWRDRAVDQNVVFTPDGRYLVFSSDRDGVYNLYACDWRARRLFRLTNVLGGLIEPAVSPDGKTIAASSYGRAGFDVVTLQFDPARAVEVPYPASEPGLAQPAPESPLPPASAAEAYRSWPSFSPKFWAPFALWDGRGPILGAASYGQDTLMRHFAYGAGGIGALSGRPYYVFSYANDQLAPTISAYASEATTFGTVLAGAGRYELAQTGRGQGLSVTLPGVPTAFLQNRWVTGDALSIAWSASQQAPFGAVDPAIPAERLPPWGFRHALALTYRYGDNYKFAYSVSPEGGQLVTLGYERALPGSQGESDRAWADWRRYWALPWARHHVLAARAQGGVAVGQARAAAYFAGGAESATLLANVDLRTASTVGSRSLPVRGYGAFAQSGQSAYAFSLEYRAPLLDVQRGWGAYPIFVRTIHGAAFLDAGQAWTGPWEPRRALVAVGAEARAQVYLQQAPTELRAGVGQGLNPGGWPVFYAEAGSAF